jgi:hypothetical protein
MKLSPKEFNSRDALVRRTGQPVSKRGPLAALLVERGHPNHALQSELHTW